MRASVHTSISAASGTMLVGNACMPGRKRKITLVVAMLVVAVGALAAVMWLRADPQPVMLVDPLIGSDSNRELSHGNTFPAVALPHGMIHWTPQTGDGHWIYQYKATAFQGIRGSHSPSVWMGDYASMTVMPMVGRPVLDPKKRAARYSHAHELARPHYYRLTLPKQQITVEVAPGQRGCRMRLTFPKTDKAVVLLDIHPGAGELQVLPGQRSVYALSRNGQRGNPPNFAGHFVIRADQPIKSFGALHGATTLPGAKIIAGQRVGAYLIFSTQKVQTINLSIASSFISREQALTTLKAELSGVDFDTLKDRARQRWNEELGRVEVESPRRADKVKFYTALYRALLFPRDLTERDPGGKRRYYSPYDGRTHRGVMYTDSGFWDTYRAQLPLLALLVPRRTGEMIQGLVQAYEQGGWLPKWPSPGYRSVMIGTHADAVIADAYARGVRNFDADKALEGMLKHASIPGSGPYAGRVGIRSYAALGYVPADQVEHATSRTLEFAYGDYCVARLAQARGREIEARRLFARARNYVNVFDRATGFMRGRLHNGAWTEPFDPFEWGGPYVEGCAWHYLWSVQHDVPGLTKLLGGRAALAAKLDAMLAAPTTFKVGSYKRVIHEMREQQLARMGQYAHPNEPVHHVLYLYNYAGQPWKTQRRVREVMSRLYGVGPDGLLGDEDTGQLSAWFVFSAMGLYPVVPGQPIYALGSPLFDRVTLRLPGDKRFVVRAEGNSPGKPYIQQATLNGAPLTRSWITHAAVVAGGELVLRMGPQPNKAWASRPADAPPGAMDQATP